MLVLLKSAMFLTLTAASNLHGFHTLGGGSGHHVVSSSDGGATISFNGAAPSGLSITPAHGSGMGFSGCGGHGSSRGSSIQTERQAQLNRIFRGNSPLPTALSVQLQGTDQREALAELDQHVCGCMGAMLYDRMTLQHVSETSFESTLTWTGSNQQDYIHVVVSNGAIVSTTISLCPDNERMSMPTVVEYDNVSRSWVYSGMRGSMTGAVGTYQQRSTTRPVPEGGLAIMRGDGGEITDSFIPTGQRSAGHTLGGSSAAAPAIMDVDAGADEAKSPELIAKEAELQKLKERLSKPPVRMTPDEIAKDARIKKMQAAIDELTA